MKFLDLIKPEKSDIPYTRMMFPDGQPHFRLTEPDAIGDNPIEVLCRIKSATDILDLGLALDCLWPFALSQSNWNHVINLNVAYLLGARMDRRIDSAQPSTLFVIAAMLNGVTGMASNIRILDPHSTVSTDLVRKSQAVGASRLVKLALDHFNPEAVIVIPDAGAVTRTTAIVDRLALKNPVARCVKKRDSDTGKLSGFALKESDVSGRDCLIVDDLCDGGGTFSGIADVLHAAGADRVALCVTHGIFSKGLEIEGIDRSYCTDSYGVALDVMTFRYDSRHADGFTAVNRRGHSKASVYVVEDYLRSEVVFANSAHGWRP